jgi:hypothetical protein
MGRESLRGVIFRATVATRKRFIRDLSAVVNTEHFAAARQPLRTRRSLTGISDRRDGHISAA